MRQDWYASGTGPRAAQRPRLRRGAFGTRGPVPFKPAPSTFRSVGHASGTGPRAAKRPRLRRGASGTRGPVPFKPASSTFRSRWVRKRDGSAGRTAASASPRCLRHPWTRPVQTGIQHLPQQRQASGTGPRAAQRPRLRRGAFSTRGPVPFKAASSREACPSRSNRPRASRPAPAKLRSVQH